MKKIIRIERIEQDLHQAFKEYCVAQKTTMSSELRDYMRRCVDWHLTLKKVGDE